MNKMRPVSVFTMAFKFLYTLIYPLHLIIKHDKMRPVSVFTMAFKFLYTLIYPLHLIIKHDKMRPVSVFTMAFKFLYTLIYPLHLIIKHDKMRPVSVFTMAFKFLYTLIYPLHLIIKHDKMRPVSVFTMAFKFLYTLIYPLHLIIKHDKMRPVSVFTMAFKFLYTFALVLVFLYSNPRLEIFNTLGTGSRTASLGGAVISRNTGNEGLDNNPAGITGDSKIDLGVNSTFSDLLNLNIFNFGFSWTPNDFSAAIKVSALKFGLDLTDGSGVTIDSGSFDSTLIVAGISYAIPKFPLQLGSSIGVELSSQNQTSENDQFFLDLGVLLNHKILKLGVAWSGIQIFNLNNYFENEFSFFNMKFGAGVSIPLDIQKFNSDLDAELSYLANGNRLGLSLEYQFIQKLFSVRVAGVLREFARFDYSVGASAYLPISVFYKSDDDFLIGVSYSLGLRAISISHNIQLNVRANY